MCRHAPMFAMAMILPPVLLAIASCTATPDDEADALGPPDVTLAQIAEGSYLYHWNDCRKCHYSSAVGGNPEHGGPSLIDDQWLHCDGSIEGIQRVILQGIPLDRLKNPARDSSMPAASEMELSEEHARLIATYIWVLGHRESN